MRGAGGGGRGARRARRGRELDARRQGRLRDRPPAGQQGLVHAPGRRAERGLRARPRARRASATCSSWSPTADVHRARDRRRDARHAARRPAQPTYRQVIDRASAAGGSPRPTSTDPARVGGAGRRPLRVADRRPYKLYVLGDPALSNTRRRRPRRRAATARRLRRDERERAGRQAAAHAPARSATSARATAGPTCRPTTAWTGATTRPTPGNVAQTAATSLTGLRGRRRPDASRSASRAKPDAAASTARAALRGRLRQRRAPLRRRLAPLPERPRRPRSAAGIKRPLRRVADGHGGDRGQDVPRRADRRAVDAVGVGQHRRATPARTTSSGRATPTRSPPRMLAAGDRAARRPRGRTCSAASRRPTAASRRTRTSTARRTGRTCSSTRSPTRSSSLAAAPLRRRHVVARQARRRLHPRQGPGHAGALGERSSATRPRRSPPRSPAWSCAAEIAERNGDAAAAARYLRGRRRAPAQRRRLDADHAPARCRREPYYLRADRGRQAERRHDVHDRPTAARSIDQRAVVDPSFLELVRLGVKPADDPAILNTLPVVDRELGVDTPNGRFWHRFNFDGYGELPDGGPFGTARQPRAAVADLRRRARRVRAADRQRARGARAPALDRRDRQQRPADARAGVGRPAAARLYARHADVLGDAARLDARAARPARLVARRRPAGRAALRRRAAATRPDRPPRRAASRGRPRACRARC